MSFVYPMRLPKDILLQLDWLKSAKFRLCRTDVLCPNKTEYGEFIQILLQEDNFGHLIRYKMGLLCGEVKLIS